MRILRKLLSKLFKRNNIFYVGASDILPPPLKREDEEALVKLSNEGDIEAKNKLIEHNLRLVVFLAKKYDTTSYDLEDLVSIGTIGLIKGVNTYRLDKNIKLATYASRCIDNEILMFLRKNKRKKAEVSFEDTINLDSEGNNLHLEDILGTEGDIVSKEYENKLDKKILLREIDKLNERDKKIITMRYGLRNTKEYTQKEVADILGISQSYISRIEKKVISHLEKLMNLC